MVTAVRGRPKIERKTYIVGTIAEVATFFGVTHSAVVKWQSATDPMPGSRGKFNLSDIAQWRQRGGGESSGIAEELKLAEIRLKTVQAQQKELDLKIQEGGLLELADVERWASICLIETREMVMTLPEILATSSPPELREFIRTETERHCRDVLAMLRRRLEADDIADKSTNADS